MRFLAASWSDGLLPFIDPGRLQVGVPLAQVGGGQYRSIEVGLHAGLIACARE